VSSSGGGINPSTGQIINPGDEPAFDILRADARFAELVSRVGLKSV